jgi:hypothetical protein
MHIFSDASSIGYAAVAYLRLCNSDGKIHCAFLIGKARITPIKTTTIPRLELTAASVSVRLAQSMIHELENKPDTVTYHTDSTTVLHYIKNEKKRFPVFVANRTRMIREFSHLQQWRFVPTKDNPADVGSRGQDGYKVLHQQQWILGPQFLKQPQESWPAQPEIKENPVGMISTSATLVEETLNPTNILLSYYSNWHRLKKAIAYYQKFCSYLQKQAQHDPIIDNMISPRLTVSDLNQAELAIIKFLQKNQFNVELNLLKTVNKQETHRGRVGEKKKPVSMKKSSLYRLDPYLTDGVIRVGGRLHKSLLPEDMKHPIVLPSKSHVTTLIIRFVHEQLGHAGRNHVLSKVRENYWVINGNTAVRRVLGRCVTCRKQQSPMCEQQMADLPKDRISPALPFTYTGVDFFGPFLIKDYRKELKRYGALFTCLVTRAIHIESACSLTTDSFIQALRRFMARRSNVQEIRCDNGTNFVGAERELREALQKMDHTKLSETLMKKNIQWKFNPPAIWEESGSARSKLSEKFLPSSLENLETV